MPQLLTVEQAARVLSLDPATIRRYCNLGQLQPAYRLPGDRAGWRIPSTTLDAFLAGALVDDSSGGAGPELAPAPIVSTRAARR